MPDDDFETAVCMLLDDGWQSSRGESVLGLKARLSSVRARNFKKGRFGDIDLHRCAYQHIQASPRFDAELLADALTVTYYEVPVFVPSVEERLVMAMGHGAWDGHHHSDWLVDIVGMLNSETVDWDRLHAIAQGRKLRGPIAIALSFLSQEINIPLPHDVLHRFGAHRARAKLRDIPSLILARDAQDLTFLQTRVRAFVHAASRFRQSGRNANRDTHQLRTFTCTTPAKDTGPFVHSHVAAQPRPVAPGTWTMTAEILFKTPAIRRRVELEINGPDPHAFARPNNHARSISPRSETAGITSTSLGAPHPLNLVTHSFTSLGGFPSQLFQLLAPWDHGSHLTSNPRTLGAAKPLTTLQPAAAMDSTRNASCIELNCAAANVMCPASTAIRAT